MQVSELENLLKVKFRHDQNIALWKKSGHRVELVRYWELERITGIKQHNIAFFNEQYALEFIKNLLTGEGLSLDDIIEIWGTPKLESSSAYFNKCKYADDLAYHNLCHLFSSILLDTEFIKGKIIVGLALDAGPDNIIQEDAYTKKYYSGCIYRNNSMEIFPVSSPGRIWAYAKDLFKLREGTLMALSSASKSEYVFDETEDLILMDSYCHIQSKEYVDYLYGIVSNLTENDIGEKFNGFDPKFTDEENKISIVMKQIQKVSTQMVINSINDIASQYNLETSNTYIALSGGYALNCPTNKAIMEKFDFIDLLAPPCVNDCGIALGLGLLSFYQKDNNVEFKFKDPFYGENDNSTLETINKYSYYIENYSDMDITIVVSDLINGPIIWFEGNSEIGPRAFGHRSILADPRNIETKSQLNAIKQREWWRPVAPIVLEEHGNDIFEHFAPSEYMLRTFNIKQEMIPQIPAVAHLNETARIQSVNENQNPVLHKIITQFYKETSIPLICNTSLNDKGEPIINKIEEAFNFALRKHINVAYINSYRINFINHDDYDQQRPFPRNIENVFPFGDSDINEINKKINPFSLGKDDIECYFDNYELYKTLKLDNINDVTKLKMHKRFIIAKYGKPFTRD